MDQWPNLSTICTGLDDVLHHFKAAGELVEASRIILEYRWAEHINIKDTQSDNKNLKYIHPRPSSNIFFVTATNYDCS